MGHRFATMNDSMLVTYAKQGDMEALDTLFKRYHRHLYTVCLKLTFGNHDCASDILQDTYVRIIRFLHCLQENGNFIRWAARIARNIYIDSLRRARNTISYDQPLNEKESDLCWEFAEDQPELDESMLLKDQARMICSAIYSLPDHFRSVCSLCLLCDMSYEEAATTLHIPLGTVKSQLNRARGHLRKSLQYTPEFQN